MRGEFVDCGGRRLYYYAAGSRGSGDPIVLLHGAATSGHSWSALVPLLPAGHRVVVVDLLGHGRSDPAGPSDMSRSGHAQRLVAFITSLAITRCAVIAHAFGAQVALEAARLAPGIVARLALLNPECGPQSAAACSAWRIAAAVLPQQALLALTRLHLESGYVDRELARHSIDQYLRPFHDAPGAHSLRKQLLARQPFVLADEVAGVSSPLLVMHGADARVSASRQGSSIGGVVRVAECRGAMPEEAPQRVASAVRQFLSNG